MPLSQMTFYDLYRRVLRFLGTSSTPSADDIQAAKDLVNDAYRRVYTSHKWSWLQRTAIITLAKDDYTASLPDDFIDIPSREMNFERDSGYPSIKECGEEEIMRDRARLDNSYYPRKYAIQHNAYSPNAGSSLRAIFYPAADTTYSLVVRIRFNPVKLVNDTDYPVGGDLMAGVILQASLAEAESREDQSGSTREEQKAFAMIEQAWDEDCKLAPASLGHYGNRQEEAPVRSWSVNVQVETE